MRVYAIGDPFSENRERDVIIIPIHMGYPIVVGVYHGRGRPPLNNFLRYFLDDARRLFPSQDPEVIASRLFSVKIRCMIADGKERVWLKSEYLQFKSVFYDWGGVGLSAIKGDCCQINQI
jgi:hypothetical protein